MPKDDLQDIFDSTLASIRRAADFLNEHLKSHGSPDAYLAGRQRQWEAAQDNNERLALIRAIQLDSIALAKESDKVLSAEHKRMLILTPAPKLPTKRRAGAGSRRLS